ncbi:pseudouridine synthase [Paracoccus sp. (in: a-proteobacteria)]|uniref:pseudouridine synthase n=1 Tax=Paracoccus sp. TaxID=267 RepID=UPI00396CE435
MTDEPHDRKAPQAAPRTEADRIAKVMARAGVASRREAERMIMEGRVSVNGKKIDSPALDVLPTDRITVDGKKLDEPQETRLWLYYKPLGLVTSESDEKGRQTVFDALPRELPRVMTIGRLDLNSEGLLLLTNDGDLKRRLELPSTGWLRRYRVRVNGTPSDMTFDPLRRGVTIEGEDFAPMEIKLDSQQGANAWISVGIREGKNREIRRAMAHIGLQVNRLIRIGYGPFKLTGMDKNEVVEVKRKVLRDQLGGLLTGEAEDKPREMRPRGAEGPRSREGRPEAAAGRFAAKPGARGFGDRPARARDDERPDRPARSWGARSSEDEGARPRFSGKPGEPRGSFGDRPRPSGDKPRPVGDKPRWKSTGGAEGRRPASTDDARPARFSGKPGEARKPYGQSRGEGGDGARKPYGKPRGDAPDGARGGFGKPRADAPDGARKPYGKPRGDAPEGARRSAAPDGARGAFGKPRGDAPEGARKPYGKPRGDAPDGARGGFGKPRGDAPDGARKPFGKPRGDAPGGRKPYDKPRPEGSEGRKPFGGPRGEGGKFQGKPRSGPGGKAPGGPRTDRPTGGFKPGGRPGGKPRG